MSGDTHVPAHAASPKSRAGRALTGLAAGALLGAGALDALALGAARGPSIGRIVGFAVGVALAFFITLSCVSNPAGGPLIGTTPWSH